VEDSVRFEEMIAMICVTAILCFSVVRVVTTFITRNRHTPLPRETDPKTDERLARIEQAMDAIAIEVERISEGQRFTTKLLSDRAREPVS